MRALRVLEERREATAARLEIEVARLLRGSTRAKIAAAERVHTAFDEAGRRALDRAGTPAPACSAGCSYCCHVHADATLPEVHRIVDHLDRTWSAEDRRALRDRLAAQVARVDGLDDDARWRAKIPCALLGGDGRCTIYEVRPLRCRAFHSCSVEPCREAFEHGDGAEAVTMGPRAAPNLGPAEPEPVASPPLRRAQEAIESGWDRALESAGIGVEGDRLERALFRALELQREEA